MQICQPPIPNIRLIYIKNPFAEHAWQREDVTVRASLELPISGQVYLGNCVETNCCNQVQGIQSKIYNQSGDSD